MKPPQLSLSCRRISLNLLAACLGFSLPDALGAAVGPPAGDAPVVIRLEAETGQRAGGVAVATIGEGFSGAGYVTGFVEDTDRVTLAFAAKAGLYEVAIRYRSPVKGFLYEVNGLALSGKFADSKGAFALQRLGKVELREGENTIAIHGGWKGYEIDRVDLTPVTALPASAETGGDFVRPAEHTGGAGIDGLPRGTIWQPHALRHHRGPGRGLCARGDGPIAGDRRGRHVKPHHGFDPVHGRGSRRNRADDRAGAAGTHPLAIAGTGVHHPGCLTRRSSAPTGPNRTRAGIWASTPAPPPSIWRRRWPIPRAADYALLMTDIDMVAGELRKLADRGIPVLWRPLHEAEGGWFWWGAKGPRPFVQLWRLMHDRLTRMQGLHNLIWVYTGTANPDWYPGDDVVDIIGIDEYPADVRDPLSATWDDVQASFGGRKLVALSEFGGAPDMAAARRLGVTWAYFASWNKDLGPRKMEPATLKSIYTDPGVINLVELPKDRWKPPAKDAVP